MLKYFVSIFLLILFAWAAGVRVHPEAVWDPARGRRGKNLMTYRREDILFSKRPGRKAAAPAAKSPSADHSSFFPNLSSSITLAQRVRQEAEEKRKEINARVKEAEAY